MDCSIIYSNEERSVEEEKKIVEDKRRQKLNMKQVQDRMQHIARERNDLEKQRRGVDIHAALFGKKSHLQKIKQDKSRYLNESLITANSDSIFIA